MIEDLVALEHAAIDRHGAQGLEEQGRHETARAVGEGGTGQPAFPSLCLYRYTLPPTLFLLLPPPDYQHGKLQICQESG